MWPVKPTEYQAHTGAMWELYETLQYGLKALGFGDMATDPIILDAHDPVRPLPDDAIIYNLEPVKKESPYITEAYLAKMRQHRVWDYSRRNVEELARFGITAQYVPIGYAPEMTRITPREKTIDVLHYGSLNERRQTVLEQLTRNGLKVASMVGVYGAARDEVIARSRVVLNCHFYIVKILEMVRVSYLLANHVCVVAEVGPDTDCEDDYRKIESFVPYAHLPDMCYYAARSSGHGPTWAEQGFDVFSKHLERDILAKAIEELPS